MTGRDRQQQTEAQVAVNTDRELWRKGDGDGNGMSYYEPSIHVTEQGAIGINVGGTVYVKPVEEWHALAARLSGLQDTLAEAKLDAIRGVLDLMSTSGRPFDDEFVDEQTIYPYSNGYGVWFISREQAEHLTGTVPLTPEEILERIEARAALALNADGPAAPPKPCPRCGGSGDDSQRDGPCSECQGSGSAAPPVTGASESSGALRGGGTNVAERGKLGYFTCRVCKQLRQWLSAPDLRDHRCNACAAAVSRSESKKEDNDA